MNLKTKDIFPLLLFGFTALLMIMAIDYPWEAKLLPLIIGAIVTILVIFQFLIEKNKRMYNRFGFLVTKEESTESSEHEANEANVNKTEDQLVSRKEMTIFLWIVFLGVAVYFLHYIVGVLCFLFLILKFLSKLSWTKTILATIIVSGCLYLLFTVVLKIAL